MPQHHRFFSLGFDGGDRPSFELPGAKPHYVPDRPGQVEHIALDLTLDLQQQQVAGTCQIRLKPVRDGIELLELDAVQQQIEAVNIGRRSARFDYDGEQLRIHLPNATKVGRSLEITIHYRLDRPQRGLYFIQPDEDYPNKPVQVWTQGEDEDSRYWFPCFDYPGQLATSELKVTVPKPYRAISNGEAIAVTDHGGQQQFHWRQSEPHPTYLMTLAVGDFAELEDSWDGIPIRYYVEKGREDQGLRTMGKTPRMVEFFSRTFGYRYPFVQYAQVCVDDFIFGGMENTACTLLTDRCLLDERAAIDNRSSETLVAHELAHQWFGDLLVIRHWSHGWIKEGMATYSESLWIDHEYGAEEAAYYRLQTLRSYLDEDRNRYRRPIVTHVYREAIELYDRHLYEKGACVYHLLRTELGEELFWASIHRFVQQHAHQTVETVDLLRSIEQTTGRNLLPLFDQYVFRGGHPDFKVSYSWDADAKLAKLTVQQTQSKDGKDLFDLTVPIAFCQLRGRGRSVETESQVFRLRIHEAEQTFYLPLATKPDFISFDVGNHALKTVELDYPLAELRSQVQHDSDPVARIQAAAALAKMGGREAIAALADALHKDTFWGVRAEIAGQLGSIGLEAAETALIKAVKDSDPRVRRAVFTALGQSRSRDRYRALKSAVEAGDASYYAEASAITALAQVASQPIAGDRKDKAVIKLLKSVLKERSGWNEVVRSAAVTALAQFSDSAEALELIEAQTLRGVPQPLRLAAIRALGPVSAGQTDAAIARVLATLRSLAQEDFFLTQVAVVTSLGRMKTPQALSLLQSLAGMSLDGRVKRVGDEAIARVQKQMGPDQSLRQLREEMDQLRQENQKLQNRLLALESKQ
ncbi:aminopeptidase [Synechococcus elongatus PCC 6301]|uniref:Aminopeptidase N n=1 Tax=Synechococcus sp. (strain ATCC 27144 / PCC 6301 / SAUG 1402/1) TaxID=269084 RepID=A0A0H3K047_SYNP6|nr:M1 family metallopeptidase [Synechococcus elongatus]BAD78604.1 aminopeptidase [Synechococcus elongatus PCC 6301]